MTIIQIDPLETGQHPIQSQSGRRACWLEGYIEVPAHLHDAVWATYGSRLRGTSWWASRLLSGLQSRSRNPSRPSQRTSLWTCCPSTRRGCACWNSPLPHEKGDAMTTVYNLCKLLIDRGRTDGLQDKMDVYLAADRLTPEEYQKLAGLLAPEQ